MKNENSVRLWRVELRSRYNYDAPYRFVEAKKSEVHEVVRRLNLRLLDFPQVWSYHLTDLGKVYNERRGKWINPQVESVN